MENTHTIQEKLSYLQSRFKSDKISVNWKDRKAFATLIDYMEELESDIDYKMYLKRLTSYIIIQYLDLTVDDGLTKIDVQKAIRKIEAIYNIDHQEWETTFASSFWPLNTKSNYNDYKALLNSLVSDVVRYNTKANDISAIQNRL